jgi:anti-anti-sigma factor
MSELTITTSQAQGTAPVSVLHLSGQIDASTESRLLDQARAAHDGGSTHILLDLTDVNVIASAGLRAIQTIFKLFTPANDVELMRKHGDEPYKSPYLKLVCPNQQIYYILNITGFMQNMLVYNNLDEALRSFQ